MLKEIYYWMIFYVKKIKTNDMPEFNAYLLICMLLFANFGSLIVIFNFLFDIDIKTLNQDREIIGLVFGLTIMIVNYFVLFKNRKEINAKYNQLPKKRKIKGMIFFWIYSIVSFPLFWFLVANLTINIK